jgi:hypothetical protein
VADCPELDLIFPTTTSQLQTASLGFESISHQGIMSGLVGVIDGWLCPIEVLPSSAVGNVFAPTFLGITTSVTDSTYRQSRTTSDTLFSWPVQLQEIKVIAMPWVGHPYCLF